MQTQFAIGAMEMLLLTVLEVSATNDNAVVPTVWGRDLSVYGVVMILLILCVTARRPVSPNQGDIWLFLPDVGGIHVE